LGSTMETPRVGNKQGRRGGVPEKEGRQSSRGAVEQHWVRELEGRGEKVDETHHRSRLRLNVRPFTVDDRSRIHFFPHRIIFTLFPYGHQVQFLQSEKSVRATGAVSTPIQPACHAPTTAILT
jgi:hypothetical protein